MRNYYSVFFRNMIIGIAGVLLLCGPAIAADQALTAAVLDLEAKEGISQGVVSTITDYLRTQLVNTNRFNIVTRENMDQVLKEQNFQMSGCTSQECIVQMGQLLGVNKMFTGSIGKVGTTYVINLKIINVESGKIDKAEAEMAYSEDQLLPAAQNLAKKMAGLATQPLAGPQAQPQPQEWAAPQQPKKITPPGSLGANITGITDNFARSFGLSSREGALVLGVIKESTAEKAQIKRGDIITGFNGSAVKGSADLVSLTSKTLTGDNVTLKVLRGGKEITIETVMQKAVIGEAVSTDRFGLTVLETTDGFLITGIKKGTFDGNSEVEVGDMIKKINNQGFNIISDFDKTMGATGGSARLLVERGNTPLNVTVSYIEKGGIGIYSAVSEMSGGDFVPGLTFCSYRPDDPGNNMEGSFRFWKPSSALSYFDFEIGYPFIFIKPIKTFTVTLSLGAYFKLGMGDTPDSPAYSDGSLAFRVKSSVEFFAGPAGIFLEGGADIWLGSSIGWNDASGNEQAKNTPFPGVSYPINAGVRFYF